MAQLEAKIRSVEAEAEAQLVLRAESVDAGIEACFHRIDAQRRGDAALERLKAKLGEKMKVTSSGDEATERLASLTRTLDTSAPGSDSVSSS